MKTKSILEMELQQNPALAHAAQNHWNYSILLKSILIILVYQNITHILFYPTIFWTNLIIKKTPNFSLFFSKNFSAIFLTNKQFLSKLNPKSLEKIIINFQICLEHSQMTSLIFSKKTILYLVDLHHQKPSLRLQPEETEDVEFKSGILTLHKLNELQQSLTLAKTID